MLDLDNTDIPLHGEQEGHGYYDEYCYLPLYVFCGRHLLLARQRRANVAGSDGAIEEMARIAQIRRKWPRVRIILRGDSGFTNEPLMRWCEEHRVDYVFGLARNSRLEAALGEPAAEARRLCLASGKPARVFRDFRYRTLDSWSRKRRVVGKAEHTMDGANPRFVVTSLKHARMADPRALYEELYCARGEAENRIGEQFELFADRASSATMAANQLRMARCTVARQMKTMGLQGVIGGRRVRTTINNKAAPCPLDRWIGSTVSSRRHGRTCCGSRTSPMLPPGRASSTSRS